MDSRKPSGEVVPDSDSGEFLGRDETCPLCGRDNQCRLAKGHLYKGLCWCERIVVPGHILSRLAAEWVEPACVCRPCLETVARVSASENDPDALLAEVFRLTRSSGSMLLPEGGGEAWSSCDHQARSPNIWFRRPSEKLNVIEGMTRRPYGITDPHS